MCENLDVDLEAIACVHSLQYSTVAGIATIVYYSRSTGKTR